jgi:tetratricopeptide (TPR) repeat protein
MTKSDSKKLGAFWAGVESAAGSIKNVALSVGAAVGVVLVTIIGVSEVRRETVEILPIEVPESLSGEGLKPEVIARRLADYVRAWEVRTRTTMAKRQLALGGEQIDIVVPGVDLSVDTVTRFLRKSFGDHTIRIGGELTKHNEVIALRLRVVGKGEIMRSDSVSMDDLDTVLNQAAERIVQATDPFIFASTFIEQDPDRALQESQRIVRELTETDENVLRAYNLWGMILWNRKDYKGAVAKFEKAIALSPHLALLYVNLGNALGDDNDIQGAVVAYRKAIEIDPTYALAYFNLGNTFQREESTDAAIVYYRMAIKFNSKYATAQNNLGQALLDVGDRDGADESFRAAIESNPKLSIAYLNLALMWQSSDKYLAITNYWSAIEAQPNAAFVYEAFADFLMSPRVDSHNERRANLIIACKIALTANVHARDESTVKRLAAVQLNLQRQGRDCGTRGI